MRKLRRGSKGPDVGQLQRALNKEAGRDDRDCLGRPYPQGKVMEVDDDFGRITEQAVRTLQTKKHRDDEEFKIDGIVGEQTRAALGIQGPPGSSRNTGSAVETPTEARLHKSEGRRPGEARKTSGMPATVPPPAGETMPVWMKIAWGEYEKDVHEIRGVKANKTVLKYLGVGHVSKKTVGERAEKGRGLAKRLMARKDSEKWKDLRMNTLDEVPWCAAFVGWCLKQEGFKRKNAKNPKRWNGNFLGAKSWRPESGNGTPRYGAITVVEWNDGGHHVGFYVGKEGNKVKMLGGNQKHKSGGAVNVRAYSSYKEVWYLWPYDIWPHKLAE